MLRDLTMIFSVMVSIASLGFGIYKNVEAGNAKGFAYEQAYRIMGIVDGSNIGATAKANILSAAMNALGTPPPVLDLSRSSADAPVPVGACSEALKTACLNMATQLADLNDACLRAKSVGAACVQANTLKADIQTQNCISCFTR